MAGYHLKEIDKGEIGELSKLYEEIEEFKDAKEQDAILMALLELSDAVGAIELYLNKNHEIVSFSSLKLKAKIFESRCGEVEDIYFIIEELKISEQLNEKDIILQNLIKLLVSFHSYLNKHHPSITIEDLENMSNITRRAFESGART